MNSILKEKQFVSVFFHGASPYAIKKIKQMKEFMEYMLKQNKRDVSEIHAWFMDNREIKKVNQKHLNHDYPTDVITFVYDENPVYADICLGIETIADNSRHHHTSKQEEVLRVLIHATLHILGYKDKTEDEKRKMRAAEDQWINLFYEKQKEGLCAKRTS